jgi:hypothetical protein
MAAALQAYPIVRSIAVNGAISVSAIMPSIFSNSTDSDDVP